MTARTITLGSLQGKSLSKGQFNHRLQGSSSPADFTNQAPRALQKKGHMGNLLDFAGAAMVWLSDQKNGGSLDDVPHRPVRGS